MSKTGILAKLYGSKSVLLVAGILLVAGSSAVTFAFLTDTDQATQNTVQSGTLDLFLDGQSNGVSNSFLLFGGQPTDTTTHNYSLVNDGTTAADHVQIAFSSVENDTGLTEPTDADLAAELDGPATATHIEVTTLVYTAPDGTTTDLIADGTVTDANGNGIVDLADVQAAGPFDNLAPPAPNQNDTAYFETTLKIANDDGTFTGTDEDMMGDGIDITVDFTLNQDSSQ